ncbi:MAG: hypothetical protein MZW92_18355 [Comamonadaceae bacterium]|nr:hypothetical protein [Comamonadaceae bacterium]
MVAGCELRVPHGGVFVLPIPERGDEPGVFVVALAAGTAVSVLALAIPKRRVTAAPAGGGAAALTRRRHLGSDAPVRPGAPRAARPRHGRGLQARDAVARIVGDTLSSADAVGWPVPPQDDPRERPASTATACATGVLWALRIGWRAKRGRRRLGAWNWHPMIVAARVAGQVAAVDRRPRRRLGAVGRR